MRYGAGMCRHSLAATSLVLIASGLVACGGARPYRAMARAATSEENVGAQLEDHRLKAHMREAILAADPGKVLDVTPYAYMDHAYLVGFADPKDGDELVRRVRGLDGVRSVDAYLPTQPASRSAADDLELKAKVKSALALEPGEVVTRIQIEALAGHVVLLGVVASPEAVASAGERVRQVSGVSGVANFLLVPEPEYESLRPRLR